MKRINIFGYVKMYIWVYSHEIRTNNYANAVIIGSFLMSFLNPKIILVAIIVGANHVKLLIIKNIHKSGKLKTNKTDLPAKRQNSISKKRPHGAKGSIILDEGVSIIKNGIKKTGQDLEKIWIFGVRIILINGMVIHTRGGLL